ncbi:guanine nucleotide exchange factor [Anaeramoeba ignava]|uniref:Guanine nucleotide exchange factor n=1 Tax=Anaeramoeba ignava TaxID=1746090 RepID=A0A9Q0RAP9_ANAIG|nr:guanine nucleotide exchange factor [Anaeramoeba ignava]
MKNNFNFNYNEIENEESNESNNTEPINKTIIKTDLQENSIRTFSEPILNSIKKSILKKSKEENNNNIISKIINELFKNQNEIELKFKKNELFTSFLNENQNENENENQNENEEFEINSFVKNFFSPNSIFKIINLISSKGFNLIQNLFFSEMNEKISIQKEKEKEIILNRFIQFIQDPIQKLKKIQLNENQNEIEFEIENEIENEFENEFEFENENEKLIVFVLIKFIIPICVNDMIFLEIIKEENDKYLEFIIQNIDKLDYSRKIHIQTIQLFSYILNFIYSNFQDELILNLINLFKEKLKKFPEEIRKENIILKKENNILKQETYILNVNSNFCKLFKCLKSLKVSEVIEKFNEKYLIKNQEYGIFYQPKKMKKEGNNYKFLKNEEYIKEYKENLLEIRKKPKNKIDLILPQNPNDLTPRWKSVSIYQKIKDLIIDTCKELSFPNYDDYGLKLENPINLSKQISISKSISISTSLSLSKSSLISNSNSISIPNLNSISNSKNFNEYLEKDPNQYSFIPINKETNFQTIKSKKHFGVWMDTNDEQYLYDYIYQYYVDGYLFISLQPKPAPITIIYPTYDLKTNQKISEKEVNIIVDFTIKVKTLIQEFCRNYELKYKKETEYALYLIHFKKSIHHIKRISLFYREELEKKEEEIIIEDEDDEFKSEDFISEIEDFVIYEEDNQENEKNKNQENEKIYGEITELSLLDEELTLAIQGVKLGTVLKLLPIHKSIIDPNQLKNKNEKRIEINDNPNETKMKEKINDELGFWEEIGNNIENIIWETETKGKYLFEKIRGASLNKSIELLTSKKGFASTFVDIFLELLPTITNEVLFIQKLFERYNIPIELKEENEENIIQEKVMEVICYKIEMNPYHVLKEVKSMINHFINEIVDKNQNDKIIMKGRKIKDLLEHKEKTRKKTVWMTYDNDNDNDNDNDKIIRRRRMSNEEFKLAPKPQIPKNIDPMKIQLMKIKDIEIARQITLHTHNLFTKIKTQELLNHSWTKKNKKELSPNITSLIRRFNYISDWVSSQILKEKKMNKRVKIMKKMIQIIEELFLIRNYNDVMCFVAGIQNSSISRLTKTWKKIPKKIRERYEYFNSITSALGGFKEMRNLVDSAELPTIPYLGVYLSDLTNIDEVPNRIENNLINWAKRRRMFDVIKKIKKFQSKEYNFMLISEIKQFFEREPVLNEDQMWELSLQIEAYQEGQF